MAEAPAASPQESRLNATALFDEHWYGRQAGVSLDRSAAVRHYLDVGVAKGYQPHPLFDPEFFRQQLDDEVLTELGPDADLLSYYLRQSRFRLPTHPLFDVKLYLKQVPEARAYPDGPVAHYCQVGAGQGLKANRWLVDTATDTGLDLQDWIARRYDEWAERRKRTQVAWRRSYKKGREDRFRAEWSGRSTTPAGEAPLVSVVLNVGRHEAALLPTLVALAGQTMTSWELLLVDVGELERLRDVVAGELPDADVRVVPAVRVDMAAGMSAAARAARGSYLAWLDAGDVWEPDRLQLLTAVAAEGGAPAVFDDLRARRANGRTWWVATTVPEEGIRSRHTVELARWLIQREFLVDELSGFDASLRGAWSFDLVARLSRRCRPTHVPVSGTERDLAAHEQAHRLPPALRPPVEHDRLVSWTDVALNRLLIDWTELAGRRQEPDTVSVIIPTYRDWQLTSEAVESVVASRVEGGPWLECVVWDNGSPAEVAIVLDSLAERLPGVKVCHSPENHGFALGNNLALEHATGATVVFLNNDTTVPQGWVEPLLSTLGRPDVLAAQSLLVYPSGAIQSAGVAFPSTGGLPHALLQGHPVEDAEHLRDAELSALTGAALAVRWEDVVALGGFDPIFTNGMEDVDFCQRLAELRPGHFRVVVDKPVIHHESRSPGRYSRYKANRRIYLDRWAGRHEPRDDVRLWGRCGYRVVDHEVRTVDRRTTSIPLPVLVRQSRLDVREVPRRLRWAIKNPAPFGPEGERWGDTHFARDLARALRSLGQEVVIDHRPEFSRSTSRHDDVALVLRGLAPYDATPEHINLGWVISHPEMLSMSEALSYDRLFAASVSWSETMTWQWGLPIEPLLQATSPERFHPDCAVPDTGHPVLFVGGSRNVERAIVRDAVAAGLPLSVYGTQWRKFIPHRNIKATYLDNAELPAAYRSAGVVLNDHWDDMRAQGFLSNRLFDAVAAGARVVTDDVTGLRDVFGESVQVYRSPEDLVRLSSLSDPDSVFGDDDARRRAASAVHREHSFTARAERLVEVAVELRKARGFDG